MKTFLTMITIVSRCFGLIVCLLWILPLCALAILPIVIVAIFVSSILVPIVKQINEEKQLEMGRIIENEIVERAKDAANWVLDLL